MCFFFCSVALHCRVSRPDLSTSLVQPLIMSLCILHFSLQSFTLFFRLEQDVPHLSVISLSSFLSLSCPRIQSRQLTDDSAGVAPVWCFFFRLYLFSTCDVHECIHTHVHTHFLCRSLNTEQYLVFVKVCQGL